MSRTLDTKQESIWHWSPEKQNWGADWLILDFGDYCMIQWDSQSSGLSLILLACAPRVILAGRNGPAIVSVPIDELKSLAAEYDGKPLGTDYPESSGTGQWYPGDSIVIPGGELTTHRYIRTPD